MFIFIPFLREKENCKASHIQPPAKWVKKLNSQCSLVVAQSTKEDSRTLQKLKKERNNKMHKNITVAQKLTFNGLPGAHSNLHLLSVICE